MKWTVIFLLVLMTTALQAKEQEYNLAYPVTLSAELVVHCKVPGKVLIVSLTLTNVSHIAYESQPQLITSFELPLEQFGGDGRYIANQFLVQNSDDSLAMFQREALVFDLNKDGLETIGLAPGQSVTNRFNLYDFFDIRPEQLKRIKFDMFDAMIPSNRGVRAIDIQSNWAYVEPGC